MSECITEIENRVQFCCSPSHTLQALVAKNPSQATKKSMGDYEITMMQRGPGLCHFVILVLRRILLNIKKVRDVFVYPSCLQRHPPI